MSEDEYIAVFVCGLIGYGAVSWLLGLRKVQPKNKDESAKRGDSESRSKQDSQKSSNSKEERKSANQNREENLFWYQVLEVSQSASVEEIRAAYRKKIAGYHPDKVANLAHEFRRLAEERSKQINEAYSTAMRIRK